MDDEHIWRLRYQRALHNVDLLCTTSTLILVNNLTLDKFIKAFKDALAILNGQR